MFLDQFQVKWSAIMEGFNKFLKKIEKYVIKKSNTFQITHVFIMFFKQLISKKFTENAIFTGPDKN